MNKASRNKAQTLLQFARVALFIGIVSLIAGCKTTGYNKGDDAANSLRRASTEVQAQNHALDLTITSLTDLVNKPAPDLKPQFATFSHNLDQLVTSANRNATAATNVSRKATAYFNAWDNELSSVNYEVIRNQGRARRSEVKKNFDEVNSEYHNAQSTLLPLIDYLQDIRKTLKADLTPGGLQAVKGFLTNAQENSAKLQTALAKVSTGLTASAASLSTVLPSAKAESTNAAALTAPKQATETSNP